MDKNIELILILKYGSIPLAFTAWLAYERSQFTKEEAEFIKAYVRKTYPALTHAGLVNTQKD